VRDRNGGRNGSRRGGQIGFEHDGACAGP
jgi:hypothetical protein